MNKNDLIKYGAIVGGVWLGYWYITNYGPGGAVSEGHVSYWDSWFGASTPAPAPGTVAGTTTNPGYPNQPPVTNTTTPPVQVAQSTIRQQIITASTGNPAIQGGYAVPDVWSYYWQQATGRTITAQQLGSAFPAGANGQGAPLTLDQFLSGLAGIGLSGISGVGAIVPAQSFSSLPSMNFGGSFRSGNRGNMRGMKPQVIN